MSAAARIRLLLVEPDPFLRELLVAALGLHDRRFEITAADEPLSAYEAVLREDLDLIITEASFPGGSSREYLPRLRRLASHLPILVLTAEANEALRASPDLDAVVRKPPEMDHLLHRVDQLLDLQRTSVVRGFALESFIQVLETERKTCTLLVEAPPRAGGARQVGALRGRLWFRDGRLLDAATADQVGRDALFSMLGWSGAVLKLADGCEATPRFTDSARALLLEYCVAKDHGQVA